MWVDPGKVSWGQTRQETIDCIRKLSLYLKSSSKPSNSFKRGSGMIKISFESISEEAERREQIQRHHLPLHITTHLLKQAVITSQIQIKIFTWLWPLVSSRHLINENLTDYQAPSWYLSNREPS